MVGKKKGFFSQREHSRDVCVWTEISVSVLTITD